MIRIAPIKRRLARWAAYGLALWAVLALLIALMTLGQVDLPGSTWLGIGQVAVGLGLLLMAWQFYRYGLDIRPPPGIK